MENIETTKPQEYVPDAKRVNMAVRRCGGFAELCQERAETWEEFLTALIVSCYWQGYEDMGRHMIRKKETTAPEDYITGTT